MQVSPLTVPMSEFEKVDPLLPRDDKLLIVWDEKGVIGSISPKRLVGVLLGLGSSDIEPVGYACRSRSGKAICFNHPGRPELFCVVISRHLA